MMCYKLIVSKQIQLNKNPKKQNEDNSIKIKNNYQRPCLPNDNKTRKNFHLVKVLKMYPIFQAPNIRTLMKKIFKKIIDITYLVLE